MVPLDRKINYRFFTVKYILYTKFCKKNPTSGMFGLHVLAFFFSGIVKMRERHQLFFGLQLLLSKEFHHQIKTEQYFGGFFHQSAPVKIGLSTCKQ
jgi:hypothetical protein